MGFGLGQTLPPKFSDFLIAHVAVRGCTEHGILVSGKVILQLVLTYTSFDGFEKLIAAAVTAGDVPAAQASHIGSTLTSANIIDELSEVVDAIPAALIW